MCLRWARARHIHVVSDEIYANSVFVPGTPFTSLATVCQAQRPDTKAYLGDYAHVAYGLSKDFGLNGFRVGVLFSHNAALTQAFASLGLFQCVSHPTQALLTRVLRDRAFVRDYLATNRAKLLHCYRALEQALAAVGVPLTPAAGSIMAWADFRRYLPNATWEAEQELWLALNDRAKVLLTTGRSCGGAEPGFFRVCFASAHALSEDPGVAMRELQTRLVRHFGTHEPPAAGLGPSA